MFLDLEPFTTFDSPISAAPLRREAQPLRVSCRSIFDSDDSDIMEDSKRVPASKIVPEEPRSLSGRATRVPFRENSRDRVPLTRPRQPQTKPNHERPVLPPRQAQPKASQERLALPPRQLKPPLPTGTTVQTNSVPKKQPAPRKKALDPVSLFHQRKKDWEKQQIIAQKRRRSGLRDVSNTARISS